MIHGGNVSVKGADIEMQCSSFQPFLTLDYSRTEAVLIWLISIIISAIAVELTYKSHIQCIVFLASLFLYLSLQVSQTP